MFNTNSEKLSIAGYLIAVCTAFQFSGAFAANAPVDSHDFLLNRTRIVRVTAVRSQSVEDQNFVDRDVTLRAGDMITVLGSRDDARFGKVVRIGVDTDEKDIPADFEISQNDLDQLGIQSFNPNFASEEEAGFHDDKYEYVITELAARGGGRAAKRRGVTRCYHFVKAYLLQKGELNYRPGGGSAFMAATELGQAGMDRGGCSPSNPGTNCTCVYKGGKHGHVEVYRGNGCWWYGYGCKAAMANLPMGQSGKRTLVTCYH